MTSTTTTTYSPCSILLFALNSSLPTVTFTASVKKVEASLLTDSGHVAETADSTIHRVSLRRKKLGTRFRVEKTLTHDGLTTSILFRTQRDDSSDIILETLIEHSVCFIEDEVLDTVISSPKKEKNSLSKDVSDRHLKSIPRPTDSP
jgi:hypothetical protein